MSDKKPQHLLIFKIIGIFGIILAVIGFAFIFTGFGDFESNNFMLGIFMPPFGLFIGVSCSLIGFMPEIKKMQTKTLKYVQEENKDDLTEIANTTADIVDDAITQTAKAMKKGLTDTKFCKYCGKEIDADSKFCSHCGKEQ